jgi:tetratricopeptide (TPR) repeat protein
MANKIILFFKIFDQIIYRLLDGTRIEEIKSYWFTEYAHYLMDNNHFEKATKSYNTAIRLTANNHHAYNGLAYAQVKKGLFKEALESCNKAITLHPDGRFFVLQSVIYKLLNENILSEHSLQSALKYFDNNLTAVYNNAAYTYREFGMYDEAEYCCKQVLKQYPEEAGAHFNLASIHLSKKQLELARQEFQKGFALAGNKRYRKYAQKEIRKIEKTLGVTVAR